MIYEKIIELSNYQFFYKLINSTTTLHTNLWVQIPCTSNSNNTVYLQHILTEPFQSEVHLESSQTSLGELFCRNSQRF